MEKQSPNIKFENMIDIWNKLSSCYLDEIYKNIYNHFIKDFSLSKIEDLPGIDFWKYEINNIPIISSKYYIEYNKNQLKMQIYDMLDKKNFFLEREIKNEIN